MGHEWDTKLGPGLGFNPLENKTSVSAVASNDGVMPSVCKWKSDELYDKWDTGCGNSFVLIDGGPADNGMKYCCYCGGELIEKHKVDNELNKVAD